MQAFLARNSYVIRRVRSDPPARISMTSPARQSPPASARIHLRITHPQLDPGEITRTLAMSPEHTLEAGRSASSNTECYWIAPLAVAGFDEPWPVGSSTPTAEGLVSALEVTSHEAMLLVALRRLQTHQAFFQRIGDDGGSATLLISFGGPGSLTIQPMVARKLADAGVSLELDWSGEVE